MRVGINPQKKESKINSTVYHRVIIVVYIPNEEGFYKNSYDVFKLCLDSIVTTISKNAAITIVNNGSLYKIKELLDLYFNQGKIDSIINHSSNIGKIDALVGAARGAREKLITLSDSDVLFVNGWQENVEKIFYTFPNVGSVSPIPIRTGIYHHTSSSLFKILQKNIKFNFLPIPENFDDYNKFLSSINWDLEIDENLNWPVVEFEGLKAILGSPHQVITIDRSILFTKTPTNPSYLLIGKNSVDNYIDIPIDKSGKLRLSTFKNFAFHMGNNLESWMFEIQKCNLNFKEQNIIFNEIETKDLFNKKNANFLYNLKKIIVKKLFKLKYGTEQ